MEILHLSLLAALFSEYRCKPGSGFAGDNPARTGARAAKPYGRYPLDGTGLYPKLV